MHRRAPAVGFATDPELVRFFRAGAMAAASWQAVALSRREREGDGAA